MSETLAYRVGRLVSGGFHAILDKAEDLNPEMAFNENIREIERAIDEVRGELGKTVAQKHLASKKMLDESNRHATLDESIQTAVNLGRDDLAQVGIGEQMDIEARLPILENTIADCSAQEKELEGFINALQAKRREMQQAVRDYQKTRADQASAHTGANNAGVSYLDKIANNAQKSGNAFDRLMQRQTGLDVQGRDTGKLASLQELENLSRDNRIAERLARLKSEQ